MLKGLRKIRLKYEFSNQAVRQEFYSHSVESDHWAADLRSWAVRGWEYIKS